MRTQKEIELICEEIRLNVQRAILKEERSSAIKKAMGLIKTYEPEIMTGVGIVAMVGNAYLCQERLLRAQSDQLKMEKAFEDYKKRIQERL